MMPAKSGQQQYEYLLFGSVAEAELPPLLHRLRGLCEYATNGGIPFMDREIGYKIEAGNASTRLKVRQSLDSPDAPWHLIYTGQLELAEQRPTIVRTCIFTACSHNLMECLKELGFVVTMELLFKGYLFKKDQMKISVFKLYQPGDSGELEGSQPVSERWLVEMSAVTSSGQDLIGNDMRLFADHLKPIVQMEKTDGIR